MFNKTSFLRIIIVIALFLNFFSHITAQVMGFENAYEQSGGPLITDDVIIVMELAEPNSCVTYQGCTVQVNGFDITITVNFLYDPPPPACNFFYNQFTDLLNIGKLPAGVYTATVTGTNVTNTPFQFSFEVFGTGNCIETDVINLGKACPGGTQVCGCNGITYANACTAFYKNGVTSWTNGACVNSCVSNPVSVNITPSAPMPICFGNTVNLTAAGSGSTGPYTYTWSNSASGGTINVPANTATYTVTVTSSVGCTATASQVVTVLEPIGVSNLNANGLSGSFVVSGGLPELNGSNYSSLTMTLQGNPGVTGTLTTAPFTHGETVSFSVPQAGDYVITVLDNSGCQTSAQILVSNNGGNGGSLDTCGFFDPNPIYPTAESLRDLDFINGTNGLLVGVKGKILRSTDGGQSWANINSGTNINLDAVDFVTTNIAWAVGHFPSGVALKSSNGGISWTPVDVGGNEKYIDVFFLDQNTGWILQYQNSILKTTDGGNSWTAYTVTNSPTLFLDKIHFVNANIGFIAAESGRVFKTTNGGQTWTITVASNQVGALNSIYFTDLNNGWACGSNDGEIVHTSNGGASWSTQLLLVGESFQSIRFFDNLNGLATSGRSIYRTTNGGNTWTPIATGIVNTIGLSEIVIFNSTVWVSGGILLKSNDNGINWNALSRGINDNISHITYTPGGIGWATGTSCLWKSQDNGSSWQPKFVSPTNFTSNTFFIDDNIGWVYTFYSLFKTIDGGNTWNEIAAPGTNIYNLNFINPNVGWAIGLSGQIYKTIDGGNSWAPQSAPVTSDLLDSYFENDQNGIIVGKNTILKTTNGGQTWTSVYSGSHWFSSISMINGNQGYAISTSQIAKTENGGDTWSTTSVPLTITRDGQFISLDTGYLTGQDFQNNKLILQTKNGGIDWTALPHSDTLSQFNTIYINGSRDIFIGGRGGIIKHNGLECPQMATPIPSGTALPTTTIEWDSVPCATGYHLSLGTTPGGTDLLNHLDLGLTTNYTPSQPFSANDTIYVQINPYDDLGVVSGCPGSFFVTTLTDTLELFISDASVTQNASFQLAVSASNFDSIAALQFTIQWDPSLFTFQSLDFGSNPLDLTMLYFNTMDANNGSIVFAYTGPFYGASVPDGTEIFYLNFQAVGAPGATGLIEFNANIVPILGFSGATFPPAEIPVNTTPGTVTILPNACTTVTITADTGPGSLREAINCANTNPGPDTVRFALQGAGPHTIFLNSTLPQVVDDSTVIDATSQLNWGLGNIILDGSNFSGASMAPMIAGGVNGLEVYGFVFKNATGGGLGLYNCRNFKIGAPGKGNVFYDNNRIGLGYPACTVGGACEGEMLLFDCHDGILQSNRFGVTEFGTLSQTMMPVGLLLAGSNIQIGGSKSAGEGNIFVNHGWAFGLFSLSDTAITNNINFYGNTIGTDLTGTQQWGNDQAFNQGGKLNSIKVGGGSEDLSNTIKFNNYAFGGYGGGPKQLWLDHNSLACNNEPVCACDASAILYQVEVTAASPSQITGTGFPGSQVEVYISDNSQCPTAPCQGTVWLGDVMTDGSGNWELSNPAVALNAGDQITATGTFDGTTWGFADCVAVTGTTGSCTTVTTTADTGPGSLREAIICANNNPGPDTILFNIPGVGPHVIVPLSSLPVITDDSTVINATTQPNFVEGSIDIFGANSPAGVGLHVEADYFELYGIFIHEFVNNELIIVGDNCMIGDSILGNIFSGNNNAEVHIVGKNNLIKKNKIGTDLTGRFDYSSIGNIGLVISGVSNVIEGNVFAGFGSSTVAYATCIHVDSGSNNTIIRSNKIGTDIFGTTLISGPNMGSISVVNSDNVIELL